MIEVFQQIQTLGVHIGEQDGVIIRRIKEVGRGARPELVGILG